MEDSSTALQIHDGEPEDGEKSTENGGGAGQIRSTHKLTRRGHTKSRRGCLTCKRRRVKCPEDQPECSSCVRLGLICEYPLKNNPSAPLQSTGGQFNLKDLMLFHHFVLHAYPPLPLHGKAVWDDITSYSHNYEFLVHSMLGLAASHLCLSGGGDHEAEALEHRVKSIKLLNQALCKPPTSKTESDARFSTLMVLTFQSSYMPDGMLEVFHMIRGCMILTKTTLPKYAMSLFTKFASGGGDKKPHEVTENNSQPTSLVLINASASLKSLRDLCRTKFEKQYLGILENLVNMASVSNMDTLLAISSAYNVFGEPDQADFNHFMDSQNHVAQLLVAHFFVLEYVIGRKVLAPFMSAFSFRETMLRVWIKRLATRLAPEHVSYLDWPLRMLEVMELAYLDLPDIPNLRISD
ncbi:unnamed protein product [Clonostachys rosea f. rosea IK726]|uniref:Zn(2)-C6 fungal-type domain-containing protein n=2 Tax=Bionectria ochroleuca TaxID=29856 RepID=A0A0B7KFV8_BIOOC|nr:unnamed protein product [Clonostachys rosea f. rosea IK726]